MELSNSSNAPSAMICNGANPQFTTNRDHQQQMGNLAEAPPVNMLSQNLGANMSINNSISQSAAPDQLNQSSQEPTNSTTAGVTYWAPNNNFIPPQSSRPPPSYAVAVKTSSDGATHSQPPPQMTFFTPTSAESSGGHGESAGNDHSSRFRAQSIPSAQSSLRQPLQSSATLPIPHGTVLTSASLGSIPAMPQPSNMQQLLAIQEQERQSLLRQQETGSDDGMPVADHSGPISKEGVITGEHGSWCSANIFVANIPSFWNEDLLREHYAPFGNIVSVKVVPSRRFGFVRFSKVEEAQRAIIETDKTRPTPGLSLLLHVSMAVHDEGDGSKPNNRIFVRGLPEWATDQLLYESVKDFAIPSKCSILIDAQKRCKGTAFVEFDTVEEATKLMEHAHLIKFGGGPQGEVVAAHNDEIEGIELKYSEPSESRIQRAARNKERVKKHMNDKVKVQAHQLQQQHNHQQQLFFEHQHRQAMLPFHAPQMPIQHPQPVPQYQHHNNLSGIINTPLGMGPSQSHLSTTHSHQQAILGHSNNGAPLMLPNHQIHGQSAPQYHGGHPFGPSVPQNGGQSLLHSQPHSYLAYNHPSLPNVNSGMFANAGAAFGNPNNILNKSAPYHHTINGAHAQSHHPVRTSFQANTLTLPNHSSTTLSDASVTSSRSQWAPNTMSGTLQPIPVSPNNFQQNSMPRQPFHFEPSNNNINPNPGNSFPSNYFAPPAVFSGQSAPPQHLGACGESKSPEPAKYDDQ